jgi:hypothetical protein
MTIPPVTFPGSLDRDDLLGYIFNQAFKDFVNDSHEKTFFDIFNIDGLAESRDS